MTPRYWTQAVAHLSDADPVLAALIEAAPNARLHRRNDAFTALARAIVGQQISVPAAATIWNRLLATAGAMTPSAIGAMPTEALRGCGLSQQKSAYLLDLATHFDTGTIDPTRWHRREDEEVIAQLVQVKGIGRWTAEMFLIFHLLRPDVLPVADIGLQRAASRHYNNDRPISEAKLRRIARVWAPWRSVATWYLWRSLDVTPVK
ncbi:MAG TPA: DNA-3-methyladenine glycosylase [Burkholderiales bacterium]|nr:DNA-3-methyladenine glycosylase [Burkholderiales bacterium]